MALQKADIQRFEWLTQQVERLGIRFPVAEISEKTGFDQGNISSYLKGKKPISDNFITSFREAYKVEGPGSDQTFTPSQLFAMFLEVTRAQTAILDRIESKMAQESTQAMIKKAVDEIVTNLPGLLNRQEGGFGIVIELLKRDALREAGGNQEKAAEILGEILSRIGPDLSQKMKESIRADGHR
jgi:hypothetical protein